MPRPRRSISRATVNAFEWRHLWGFSSHLVLRAPSSVTMERMFRHLVDRIDCAVIDGNLGDMDMACTALYLHCMQEVRNQKIMKWWLE